MERYAAQCRDQALRVFANFSAIGDRTVKPTTLHSVLPALKGLVHDWKGPSNRAKVSGGEQFIFANGQIDGRPAIISKGELVGAAVFGGWSRLQLATFLILEIGMCRTDNADAVFIHSPPSSGRTVGTRDRPPQIFVSFAPRKTADHSTARAVSIPRQSRGL